MERRRRLPGVAEGHREYIERVVDAPGVDPIAFGQSTLGCAGNTEIQRRPGAFARGSTGCGVVLGGESQRTDHRHAGLAVEGVGHARGSHGRHMRVGPHAGSASSSSPVRSRSCQRVITSRTEVHERFGHTTLTTTMDIYSHVTPTMQQFAVDRFAVALSGTIQVS